MDYRGERDALRARVESLQERLAQDEETIAALRGERSARRTRQAKRAVLVAGLLLLAGSATFGVVALVRHEVSKAASADPSSRLSPSASPAAAVDFIAFMRPPMFAGVVDVPATDAIVWGTSEDKGCLAAIAAQSGARRWLACPYDRVALNDGRAAVVGERLLVDFERKLDAFDVKSGAKLWTTRLDERTMEYCPRPDGTLAISLEGGGGTFIVNVETGGLTPSTRTYDCRAIWSDWPWHARSLPGQSVSSKGWFGTFQGPHPEVEGVVPEMAVRGGGRVVVLGYARPGRHVPVAAALGDAGALIWKRTLPPESPSLADRDGPPFAALDDQRLCAAYPGHDEYRLGCWEAATGATLWDVAVKEPMGGLHGVAIVGRTVVLLHWQGFAVFDLASGAWLHDVP